MKTQKIFFAAFIMVLMSTAFVNAQEIFQDPRVTKLWETKEGLKTPESVIYDGKDKVLYVANINGKAWEKDGNGFISKLSMAGDFLALEWVKGLNGPKGMGIFNGKLYVTDIDEVVEIDIATAKIINKYKNEKTVELNDISVGEDGTVYASDTGSKCIFEIKNGKLEVLIESDAIAKTNGLWANGEELLAGQSNSAVAINLKTKAVRTLVDQTGYIDGFVSAGNGRFLIADWQGHVQLIEPGKPNQKLLDTTPLKINAADIDYIISEKILLVPTFLDNRVMAYKVKL
jgi:sugar lactone lactonase YvrE